MKSVQQQVQQILDKDIAVQKCLKQDLINTRALARYLIKEHGLSCDTDAAISAIRRYDLEGVSTMVPKEAADIFNKMSITTKDEVARIVLREKAFSEVCADFIGKKLLKDNVRLMRSKETITLIVSQRELEKKLAIFKPADVLEVHKDLCEIRMHFPKTVDKIKGIFARITAELALNDINIEEMIYSVPDWLIYVKQESLIEAHKSLLELKKGS
ncbi:hypothetical protein HYV86_00335 [Candidatus Woesearchaeota archaeon]|nr:hypothetical protein [Candidatus Woesearchaeota archaeon]